MIRIHSEKFHNNALIVLGARLIAINRKLSLIGLMTDLVIVRRVKESTNYTLIDQAMAT